MGRNNDFCKFKNEIKVSEKVKEKGYELIEPFNYINCSSVLHLRCSNNHCIYEWHPTYHDFITHDTNCRLCFFDRLSVLKTNPKLESEEKVNKKIKEKGYELTQPFIYESGDSRIYLKCCQNHDDYFWDVSYNNLINQNRGCKKCMYISLSKQFRKSQEIVEKEINDKCLEKKYTLIAPFNYVNGSTRIHLKCNKHVNYIWTPTYDNFIYGNQGCNECKNEFLSKLKTLSQEEAEENITLKCNENDYIFKPFIYNGVQTKITLKCSNPDHVEWHPTYDSVIHSGSGCPDCGRKII